MIQSFILTVYSRLDYLIRRTSRRLTTVRANRLARLSQTLVTLALATPIFLYGGLDPIDLSLMDARSWLIRRPPSDTLVIVEIDHRSLSDLVTWPWPRDYHAQVLDNLFAAGARSVGVDIDFSSSSSPAADAALAKALKRYAGRVILPAFLQTDTSTGATVATFPNRLFRDYVKLGAVNVRQAEDGLVRQLPYGELFGDTAIPSLAGYLAGVSGTKPPAFYLDYGIRVRDAPRLSFVDVLRGNFDPSVVAGRNVLIGATAVELGDQFAVPTQRVLPGPILQALGYESLLGDRALQRTGIATSFVLTVCCLCMAARIARRRDWQHHLLALVASWTLLGAVSLVVGALAPISVDIAMPALAALLYCLLGWLWQLEQQAQALLQQRAADTRRQALMQSVLEDSFDGILVADRNGFVEMANKAAGRLLGRPTASLLGLNVNTLLPVSLPEPDQLTNLTLEAEDFAVAPLAPTEIVLPRPNGSELIFELAVSCSHVKLGFKKREVERVFLTYTFRDITERHHAEQRLRVAMDEALAASRTKTEFLANMSHELRTPLNAIIGFSEIIQTEVFGALPNARYREYAKDINGCGNHLLEVINDILEMAKFESGQHHLNEDEFDIAETVDQSLAMVRGISGAASLTFRVNLPSDLPRLLGDARLVRQMVTNLLSNAVKFTPAGGAVRVSCEQAECGLKITITDTGIGIPADEIPKIVQPFYQVDSELARKYEGTGLGLALVNSFMQLHQGEMCIESTLDEGTSVSLLFPRERVIHRGPELGLMAAAD